MHRFCTSPCVRHLVSILHLLTEYSGFWLRMHRKRGRIHPLTWPQSITGLNTNKAFTLTGNFKLPVHPAPGGKPFIKGNNMELKGPGWPPSLRAHVATVDVILFPTYIHNRTHLRRWKSFSYINKHLYIQSAGCITSVWQLPPTSMSSCIPDKMFSFVKALSVHKFLSIMNLCTLMYSMCVGVCGLFVNITGLECWNTSSTKSFIIILCDFVSAGVRTSDRVLYRSSRSVSWCFFILQESSSVRVQHPARTTPPHRPTLYFIAYTCKLFEAMTAYSVCLQTYHHTTSSHHCLKWPVKAALDECVYLIVAQYKYRVTSADSIF